MKCPLKLTAVISGKGIVSIPEHDCLKEECAWWEQDLQLCAMKELALETRYLQLRVVDILDKMPHEEQFRK